jgi:hypothetical protein
MTNHDLYVVSFWQTCTNMPASFLVTFCDQACDSLRDIVSLLLRDGLDEPLHSLLETLFSDCRACLDGPCAILYLHQSQAVHDLLRLESEL